MDHQALKKVVKHSLTTAVVGDTIGAALDTVPQAYHSKVFRETAKLTKSVFPPKNGTRGIPSQTSVVAIEVLNLLLQHNVTVKQLPKVNLNLSGVNADSLVLGLAAATGYFAALKEFTYDDWFWYSSMAGAKFDVATEYLQTYMSLSYLIFTLSNDGYLRSTTIDKVISNRLVSGNLQASLNYVTTHQFDKTFMTSGILDHTLLAGLNHVERILLKSVFYMFQTFTGWKTKPRFFLDEIVGQETDSLADTLFVFGALCTGSEHHYLLFTKPLQEQVQYREKISNMLTKC